MTINDKTYFLTSNNALFEETLKEFSSKSFQSASLNTIIQLSKFNKGSFYYRFKDKFDLYLALIDYIHVLQSDSIDELLKMTHETNQLQEIIILLFETQVKLYQLNPLYLNFLIRYENEDDLFKKNVSDHTSRSILTVFFDYLKLEFKNHPLIDESNSILFINMVENCYYHLSTIMDSNFSDNNLKNISIMLVKMLQNSDNGSSSIYFKNDFRPLILHPESRLTIDVKKNSKMLIIEPLSNQNQQSFLPSIDCANHKSGYRNFFHIGLISLIKWLRTVINQLNPFKSGRQKLAYYAKLNNNEIVLSQWHHFLSMHAYLNQSIRTYNMDERLSYRFLKESIKNPSLIILNHIVEKFSEHFRDFFIRSLQLLRNEHLTLIIVSSHFYDFLDLVDDVLFIYQNHVIQSYKKADLIKKYGKTTIIIQYIDHEIEKTAAFNQNNLNTDYLNKILQNYTIKSIRTCQVYPDEIYKLETGVTLE